MYSIESAHHRILDKYHHTITAVELLPPLEEYAHVAETLDAQKSEYYLAVMSIIGEYYDNHTSDTVINQLTMRYYQIITSNNFIAQLDSLISVVEKWCDALKTTRSPVTKNNVQQARMSLSRAKHILMVINAERVVYDYCESCHCKMSILHTSAELQCNGCYAVKPILGLMFNDDSLYQQSDDVRQSGHDTNRHFRYWVERIQALENKTFPPDVLNNIAHVIQRDGIVRVELTYDVMRNILKDTQVKATKYNNHIPLLIKTFGGKSPPHLTHSELETCSQMFNTIIRNYDALTPNGGYRPYYPYFIYKIFEQVFADSPEKLRLLNYIHLQQRDTVIKNDKIYAEICKREPSLVYKPTDRSGRR